MFVIGKRLKEARLRRGLSQEKLGVAAGIEEASASARMNRYEVGTRSPGYEFLQRVATVLDVPVAFFYSDDDQEAALLIGFHRLPRDQRAAVVASVQSEI